jgi:hypothetical protein
MVACPATGNPSRDHDEACNITADDRAGIVYYYRYNNRGRLDRPTIGSTRRIKQIANDLARVVRI